MEIQTFLLCEGLDSKEGRYNGSNIGVHSFFSKDGSYPLEFSIPYYMLLRRPERESEKEVNLRFNLIDKYGKIVGEPRNINAKGIFPAGHRFMNLYGTIRFSFPRIDDYRLVLTADEDKLPSIYSYDIEVTEAP